MHYKPIFLPASDDGKRALSLSLLSSDARLWNMLMLPAETCRQHPACSLRNTSQINEQAKSTSKRISTTHPSLRCQGNPRLLPTSTLGPPTWDEQVSVSAYAYGKDGETDSIAGTRIADMTRSTKRGLCFPKTDSPSQGPTSRIAPRSRNLPGR